MWGGMLHRWMDINQKYSARVGVRMAVMRGLCCALGRCWRADTGMPSPRIRKRLHHQRRRAQQSAEPVRHARRATFYIRVAR